LCELLLEKGYTVHGIVRRTSNLLRSRIEHLRRDEKIYGRRLFLHYSDLSDSATLSRIAAEVQPTELYYLAGQDRPAEPARLAGCADKIRKILGWKPAGTFRELVGEMVEAELAAIDSRD